MFNLTRILTGSTLIMFLFVLASCATTKSNPVVARIGEEPIYQDELDQHIPDSAMDDVSKIYDTQKKELTRLIAHKILTREATRNELSLSELLAKKVYRNIEPIEKADIKKYYKENKKDFKKVTFKEARGLIQEVIFRQRRKEAFSKYFNDLVLQKKVQVFLKRSTN